MLQKLRRGQVALLCITLAAAAVALYLGPVMYSMSTGWMAVGHYVRDRFTAAALVMFALLLNFLMARTLGLANPGTAFWVRYGLSVAASLIGAALIYAIVWRGLGPLFS